jgi:hypothetical protein
MGGPMGRLQEWSCILAYQQNLNIFESVKLSVLQGIAWDVCCSSMLSGFSITDTVCPVRPSECTSCPRPISYIHCTYETQTINTALYGDMGGLKQITINLVDNAIHHCCLLIISAIT